MEAAFTIVLVLFLVFLFNCLVAGFVELLWNELLPQLFHLPLITFWQAFGLVLLFGLLFRGFGYRSSSSD